MKVVSEPVVTKWSPRNRQRYESFGYLFTGNRKSLTLLSDELSEGSQVRINAICPRCGSVRAMARVKCVAGKVCKSCSISDINKSLSDEQKIKKSNRLKELNKKIWTDPAYQEVRDAHIASSSARRGENSPIWKGGPKTRRSVEYADWRRSVIKRDLRTCRRCGATGGRIDVHHIEGYAKNPDLRVNVNNGITLCILCHREFHSIYGTMRHSIQDFHTWFMIGRQNVGTN